MRPCSDTPTFEDVPSSSSLREYTFVKIAGSGTQGIVIEVDKKGTRVAVKIVPLTERSIEEVKTQCLLTDLREKTRLFAHAFGWQIRNGIPSHWERFLKKYGRVLLIFMEKTIENWSNAASLLILPNERKAILFLILHGMYWGRKLLNFDHSDLHSENIMLQHNYSEKPIKVSIENQQFVLPAKLRFIPKLIDFGYSTTKFTKTYEESESEDDDLFASSSNSSTDVSSLKFIFPELESIIEKGDHAFERALLSDYFSEYRRICNVCNAKAHFLGCDEMLYCSNKCFYLR